NRSAATARMRARGGIPSALPIVTVLGAIFMAPPLDIGVTGQYLYVRYRSVPQGRYKVHSPNWSPDRGRIKRHETPSITLAASLARASAVRSRRRTTGRIRSGGPADRDHGHAAMAWSDGGSGNCPGEPTHRRHASPPAHSTQHSTHLGRTPERQPRWRP